MQEAFIRSDKHFSDLVEHIEAEQWNKKSVTTPDWTVKQLVGHVTENNLAVCKAFGDDTGLIAEIDDNPIGAWQESAHRAESAVNAIKNLDEDVETPMGNMSAEDFLTMMTTDRLVHGYDLAIAIGADSTLNPELVELAYAFVEPRAETMREGGVFGPAVDIPEDASTRDKLLAVTGRQPR